jgi:hypothetical protein
VNEPSQPDPAPLAEIAPKLGPLIAEGRLGFLAAAMTPWHAIGVDAWVRRLRAEGEHRPGAVVLLPSFRDGLYVAGSDFPLSLADGDVAFHPVSASLAASGGGRAMQMLTTACRLAGLWLGRPGPAGRPGREPLRIGSPGYAAAGVFLLTQLCKPRAVRRADVRFVLIDEGLGTYVSKAVADVAGKRDRPPEGRIVGGRWMDDLLYQTWRNAQARTAAGYPRESRFLFAQDPETGLLAINDAVTEDYRQAIRAAGVDADVLGRAGRPVALILPQPWAEAESDPAAAKAEIDTLCRVSARLVERGYDVRLKPHPRERAGKYDEAIASGAAPLQLVEAAIAAERVFDCMEGDDIVLGFNSSALITSKLLFGLRTWTLSNLLIGAVAVGEMFLVAQQAMEQLAGPAVGRFEDEFGEL